MRLAISRPLLSILVPAYRYVDGVYRILASFHPWPVKECEVIIFDDSQDDEVERAVAHWCGTTGAQVRYQHNRPARGAAANWNSLLDAARGDYCLLLHHDEFPLTDHFVGDLVTALREDPNADVLMLDCILVATGDGRNRRHLPTWLRALVMNRYPYYLFRRNAIGPTAALVIRRSLYPRFDVRLRWLVDVDLYVRLRRIVSDIRALPDVKIGSMLGRSDSITASLESNITQLAKDERIYLQARHPTAGLWLGPVPGESVLYGFFRIAETVCWSFMRVLTRRLAAVFPDPVPRLMVQEALQARPKL